MHFSFHKYFHTIYERIYYKFDLFIVKFIDLFDCFLLINMSILFNLTVFLMIKENLFFSFLPGNILCSILVIGFCLLIPKFFQKKYWVVFP